MWVVLTNELFEDLDRVRVPVLRRQHYRVLPHRRGDAQGHLAVHVPLTKPGHHTGILHLAPEVRGAFRHRREGGESAVGDLHEQRLVALLLAEDAHAVECDVAIEEDPSLHHAACVALLDADVEVRACLLFRGRHVGEQVVAGEPPSHDRDQRERILPRRLNEVPQVEAVVLHAHLPVGQRRMPVVHAPRQQEPHRVEARSSEGPPLGVHAAFAALLELFHEVAERGFVLAVEDLQVFQLHFCNQRLCAYIHLRQV
mmetsp:Transcript_51193/g.134416  ORF Transcript_51193/g.134416 Transcript_51193/m.134416 type:complete len:256 (+) Transcript_51193:1219-1986(+)